MRRQAPAATHVPTRPAAAAPAETAALGPVRASRATAPEPRPLAPTRPLKEPSLPLDEDQFDIPTFLRRQGQGDFQVGSPQTALLERYRYIRCRWLEPSSAANRKPRNTMTR